MRRGAGSWSVLAALAALFLLAFAWQRAGSTALWLERAPQLQQAQRLAAAAGVPVADVLALWEILGADADLAVVETCCRDYARRRGGLGDEAAAAAALPPGPEVGTRFRWRRERFAARAAAAGGR